MSRKRENVRQCKAIRQLIDDNKYTKALELIDAIPLEEVGSLDDLYRYAELYEKAERMDKKKEIFYHIYHRTHSRYMLNRLLRLTIRMGDMEEARELYFAYEVAGPITLDTFELRYLLAKAEGEPPERLIQILEELKKEEYTEEWGFRLACLYEKTGQKLDTHSLFDVQIKRLHEYKRQQLNVLYVIHKYLEIKAGKLPTTPVTVIFGAKAAPAYTIAKDIIHLILCLQEIINKDPEVNKYLNVVMVENYNVTLAEKLIPACDISEQISLASKEASGTGNMKFMLNGAVTLGTEDGANVEIHELVGDDNIYIFGASSDEVIAHYAHQDYNARSYYENNAGLREAVDFIVSEAVLAVGNREMLERLYNELLNKDWFMTFLDYDSYVEKKDQAYKDYEDRLAWAKKMMVNIGKAGFFSSDRTIAEYNNDIWHLED